MKALLACLAVLGALFAPLSVIAQDSMPMPISSWKTRRRKRRRRI